MEGPRARDLPGPRAYADIAFADDEWSVAASCRAAETLLDYVRFLRGAPPPRAIEENPEAIAILRKELAAMALPVEQEATKQIRSLVDTAAERGVDSVYARRCRGQLDVLTARSAPAIPPVPAPP